MRVCEWCERPIRPAARRDAKTCSKKCRQASQRFRVGVAPDSSATRPMRFAYFDPPYPGLARKYYGPDAQEVNHRILIGTAEREYPDGWALSTSSSALAEVLALCPPEARVAAWLKGSRRSVSYRPRDAWEPLIVVRGRKRRMEETEELSNALIWGGRQHSHPDALVGMKPAAFCEWMFRQLGAEVTDDLDDIFPGSGAVSRAWKLFAPGLPPQLTMFPEEESHAAAGSPSRLAEAQSRLAEQLGNPSCPQGDGAVRQVATAETSNRRTVECRACESGNPYFCTKSPKCRASTLGAE